MSDRMLTWMGAGVLAAGVCTASLTGAAAAAAEDDSGAGTTTSSQSPGDETRDTDVTATRVSAKPPSRSVAADPDGDPASPDTAGDTDTDAAEDGPTDDGRPEEPAA